MAELSFQLESYETPSGSLDLFSTSSTELRALPSERCAYGAPFFAFKREGSRYGVVQGCCNHWECPRCGRMVAAKHYGRIVNGAREIAQEDDIWFVTITCRGKELSREDALKGYLLWTKRFLDACHAKTKRAGNNWFYVQVTELQRRGHPHSHILTTFSPTDLETSKVDNWKRDASGILRNNQVEKLRSAWIQEQAVRSGLGNQYDLSVVETVEAASRYVAKYMFKDSQFGTHFPKGWKRVRYSQSWPKLPGVKTDAFVLLSRDDWNNLAARAVVVDASRGEAFEIASHYLQGHDIVIHERKEDEHGYRNVAV